MFKLGKKWSSYGISTGVMLDVLLSSVFPQGVLLTVAEVSGATSSAF